MLYTYTIFDGNPAQSWPCAWPHHEDRGLDAATLDEAREAVAEIIETEGDPGDTLWYYVWDEDEIIVADGSVTVGEG